MMSHIMASSHPPPSWNRGGTGESGGAGLNRRAWGVVGGTHGVAVDSGDDGFADSGDLVPAGEEGTAVALLEGFILHLFDVGPGCKEHGVGHQTPPNNVRQGEARCPTCEGFLAAGEDDGPHLRVALQGLQRPPQLLHQPLAEGVERLRPVQLDQAHALPRPRLLHCQVLERGPCPPPPTPPR